jgi:hypothetical protein
MAKENHSVERKQPSVDESVLLFDYHLADGFCRIGCRSNRVGEVFSDQFALSISVALKFDLKCLPLHHACFR